MIKIRADIQQGIDTLAACAISLVNSLTADSMSELDFSRNDNFSKSFKIFLNSSKSVFLFVRINFLCFTIIDERSVINTECDLMKYL